MTPLANFSPVSTTRLLALGADVPDLARLVAVAAGVGHVDAAVVADDQVVAAEALGDRPSGLPLGVVGEDLLGAAATA